MKDGTEYISNCTYLELYTIHISNNHITHIAKRNQFKTTTRDGEIEFKTILHGNCVFRQLLISLLLDKKNFNIKINVFSTSMYTLENVCVLLNYGKIKQIEPQKKMLIFSFYLRTT